MGISLLCEKIKEGQMLTNDEFLELIECILRTSVRERFYQDICNINDKLQGGGENEDRIH